MADAIMIRKGDNPDLAGIVERLGLPCFVKPTDSGSSFGVTKVNAKEELISAVEKAFKESDEIMIEAYIRGRELACGVVKTGSRTFVLPVTEIISKNEFFDYEAKYTPGRSEEITPAMIKPEISHEIQKLSLQICDLLGCKGIVRVDFILTNEKPVFLEINTIPGMSAESIIPKQAMAAGIELSDLYSIVIEDLFI
jgi:D-alanine-D-alanine ligase